jgi:hypothetical protein
MFTFLRRPHSLQIVHELKVPTLLQLLIGYDSARGDARSVGVTYGHRADSITVHDGEETYDCPADGWVAFHRHARVSASLAKFDFGDGGYPTHMFIIDRGNGAALVGSMEAATQFLDERRSHRIPYRGTMRLSRSGYSGTIREMRAAVEDAYQSALRTSVTSLVPDLRIALDMGI